MRQFFGLGLGPYGRLGEENWSLMTWAPACDIYETDNEIVVKAELPEVKSESAVNVRTRIFWALIQR